MAKGNVGWRRVRGWAREIAAAALAVGASVLAWPISAASADALVQPSVVEFGEQPRGVRGPPRQVELVNTGRSQFRVYRSEVNSGRENIDFVVTTDRCSGATLEPGERCPLEIAFRPTGLGRTSQTVGIDVSGPDYLTFGERAATVTLNGVGVEAGAVPLPTRPPVPGPPGAPLPMGLIVPAAGLGALGLGFLLLASAGRAPARRSS